MQTHIIVFLKNLYYDVTKYAYIFSMKKYKAYQVWIAIVGILTFFVHIDTAEAWNN